MAEAGDGVRVRMLLLGKAGIAEVKIRAFGAAMAHAGDVLLETMITSNSNMNALIGISTSCRCLGGLCSLLFCDGSKLACVGRCNEIRVVLWALLRHPLAVGAFQKRVPGSVA